MTADDVLAHIADSTFSRRPPELRSDRAMLRVWLKLRSCPEFRSDIIERHNLRNVAKLDLTNPAHEHALGNAYGHCVQAHFTLGR